MRRKVFVMLLGNLFFPASSFAEIIECVDIQLSQSVFEPLSFRAVVKDETARITFSSTGNFEEGEQGEVIEIFSVGIPETGALGQSIMLIKHPNPAVVGLPFLASIRWSKSDAVFAMVNPGLGNIIERESFECERLD